jgi:hypothetical protein
LWNGQDPILKERLFGLTNSEGKHGEDVKEYYFYLDSTPTHSYMKYLYKYPQAAYPQAGWTGIIARAMHLFATSTAEEVLDLGQKAVFTEVPPAPSAPVTRIDRR